MSSNVAVYRANNWLEANLIKSMLELEGIDVFLLGEYLMGAIGELSADVAQVELQVSARDKSRAEVLVKQYLAADKSGVEWSCNACGEANGASFELCWHCGAVRR
ncbi:MAG: DUF2007 domain-containing protein [Kangiellaceae bacterium]|jgi:hypothetical protein|nr:DUF2007 domain-containing protein [Kangiellaceae bacterium]